MSAVLPVTHNLKRESTGNGMGDSTTPTCTCGWRGVPVGESNDWMMHELAEQERKHLAETPAFQDAQVFAAGIAGGWALEDFR